MSTPDGKIKCGELPAGAIKKLGWRGARALWWLYRNWHLLPPPV